MESTDFLKSLIKPNASIKAALQQLNRTSQKVLFVVDENNILLGALTDGDIRRALLQDIKIDVSIAKVYNPDPVFFLDGSFSEAEIKETFIKKCIECIPLVNERKKIVRVILWNDFFENKKPDMYNGPALDIPVVIMAGGKGTRMAPFTNVLPKPLIPIGEKTILEIIIDNFRKFGISDIFLTVNFKAEMIQAYFNCIEKDYSLKYLKETDFYGTAGSLSLLPKDLQKTFIVSNCDIIVKANIAKVIDFHRSSGAHLTVLSSLQNYKIPYGVLKFENGGIITGMEEKPEYTFCVNTGVYILEPDCLEYLPDNQLFHMTHLMEALMKDGKRVVTYPVGESDYIDIGQWDEYKKAINVLDIGK